MERNYYAVLGVPETASHEAIQEAFRRLARTYHPDVSGADTAHRFQEIQEAWEVLGDAQQRRAYDERTRRHRAGPTAFPSYARSAKMRQPFSRERTAAAGRGFLQAGATLHLELRMSPAEAAAGGDLTVALPAVSPCSWCGGMGRGIGSICPVCRGTGSCVQLERFTLHVPAGLRHGAVVPVSLEEFDLVHRQLVIHVTVDVAI